LAYCTYPRRLIDDDDEDDFLEQLVEWIWQGKPKYSEETCPRPLCPTTNSHMTTRTAAVGSQRLTAWATARPSPSVTVRQSIWDAPHHVRAVPVLQIRWAGRYLFVHVTKCMWCLFVHETESIELYNLGILMLSMSSTKQMTVNP
jgi:hypothetical protein